MFKVIIIDDEQIIRDGLKSYINENTDGFTVSSVFEDGADALEYIKENQENIDVVLTDIRMNTMSGTELVKNMHDLGLDILTLFLSSFREYEYAKTAIKYNVFAYLEKPIDFQELDEVFEDVSKTLSEKLSTDKANRIFSMISELGGSCDTQAISSFYNTLILETTPKENTESSNSLITIVLNWINENYNQNITLAKAADYVMLSPVYFGRLFKIHTGETFNNYLTKLRLGKARALLKNTSLNVQEVSNAVGYNDVNYFIRLFKKEHGVTPHKYKNNQVIN